MNQATTNNAITASTVFIAFSANTAYSAYTMAYMPTYISGIDRAGFSTRSARQ